MRKYRVSRRRLSLLIACALGLGAMQAQSLGDLVSPLPEGYLERAMLMDASGNSRGVIDQISRLQTLGGKYPALLPAKAYYLRGDDRCVDLLENFIADNPASQDVGEALMLLGDFYFFDHDFARALQAYDRLDILSLNSVDEATYSYRKAFSLIRTGHYDQAIPLLSRLKKSHKYEGPATFFLAYIDYVQKRYDDAYEGFEEAARINGDEAADRSPSRSGMRRKTDYVPTGLEAGYYLVQIDFMRGEYHKVIDNGESLLRKMPVKEFAPETQRIIGESYFKLGDTEQAENYLSEYLNAVETPNVTALYTMGVLDYDAGRYEAAAEKFSTLTDLNNDLAQSAALYLGQCAIREGDDDLAAISFKKAYTLNYDRKVAETALYNYIAAITRGGKVPFASSVDLLNEFVENYPNSRFAPEVEQYLAVAYYNEHDYEKALQAINLIAKPDAKAFAAKQKILFELGVRALSNDEPKLAETYLTEAQSLARFDSKVATQVDLWLADALYAQKKYADAQKEYSSFVANDKSGENATLGLYNLAYALYMQDKFSEALTQFDAALKGKPALPESLRTDALVRKADCLYYLGNLHSASDAFAQAIKAGSSDADYAAMRQAVIAGVDGNNAEKVRLLDEMVAAYPNSKWVATALLEKALAYSEMGKPELAIDTFDDLAKRYPNSPETRTALLQMGLLSEKTGNSEAAISAYQQIIREWPSSQEAELAGDDLRRIYASRGELNLLAEFLKNVPGAPQLDEDEVEELTFEAAASAFAVNGKADMLLKYIEDYPDGRYLAQAMRDIADYQAYDLQQPDAALTTIAELLEERPDAPQVPGALLLKAEILEEYYPDDDDEILATYRLVEEKGGSAFAAAAWAGIMRNTPDPKERIEYARMVKQAGGVSSEAVNDANYYESSGVLSDGSGDTAEAINTLTALAENPMTLAGSRAAVDLGEYYVDTKQFKKAETLLSKFTDSGTPFDYWLARGYIALADAYRGLGKKTLALEYIKSLKSNYPGNEADIAEMINQRINAWK